MGRRNSFQQVYDERFAAQYGVWRPIVERLVTAFLKCGDFFTICRYVERNALRANLVASAQQWRWSN